MHGQRACVAHGGRGHIRLLLMHGAMPAWPAAGRTRLHPRVAAAAGLIAVPVSHARACHTNVGCHTQLDSLHVHASSACAQTSYHQRRHAPYACSYPAVPSRWALLDSFTRVPASLQRDGQGPGRACGRTSPHLRRRRRGWHEQRGDERAHAPAHRHRQRHALRQQEGVRADRHQRRRLRPAGRPADQARPDQAAAGSRRRECSATRRRRRAAAGRVQCSLMHAQALLCTGATLHHPKLK